MTFLYELNRCKTLDVGELKYLVNMIWDFKPSSSCNKALQKLELNADGTVNIAEFVLLNRHYQELLSPLRKLKVVLQKRTVYKRFWKQLTDRRIQDFKQQSFFEICDRDDVSYVQSSMEYLNLRSDIVPPEFVAQWQFIQRKKQNRGNVHKELPYEIRENIESTMLKSSIKLKYPKSRKLKHNTVASENLEGNDGHSDSILKLDSI